MVRFEVGFLRSPVLECGGVEAILSRFQCQPIQPDTIGGNRSLLSKSMDQWHFMLTARPGSGTNSVIYEIL